MRAAQERSAYLTVIQAARHLGLGTAAVRRHAQNGNLPDAVWHEPVVGFGYYLLGPQSLSWLRDNVEPRPWMQGKRA